MAEAARGFMPRNSGAFADPRGAILIDDAKTFFSAQRRALRPDHLGALQPVGERRLEPVHARVLPPHPRPPRARRPAGAVVPALRDRPVAGRLGDARAGRGVPALRGVRAERPRPADRRQRQRRCRCRRRRACSSSPGLAKELWTVHVLCAGDLDARYLGGRALLEPLFASYGMPANSDYAPLLDLHAARHRFTEKSATDLVALLNAERAAARDARAGAQPAAGEPAVPGCLRLRADRERAPGLVCARLPDRAAPARCRRTSPTQLQKDLDLVKLRLLECREPRDFDVWLQQRAARRAAGQSAPRRPTTPAPSGRASQSSPCYLGCAPRSANGSRCFAPSPRATRRAWRATPRPPRRAGRDFAHEAREYLLLAAMSGAHRLARAGARARAVERALGAACARRSPAFRLLRCHAERAGLRRRVRRLRRALSARDAHRAEHLLRERRAPPLSRCACGEVPVEQEVREPVHQRPCRGRGKRRVFAQVRERLAAARMAGLSLRAQLGVIVEGSSPPNIRRKRCG